VKLLTRNGNGSHVTGSRRTARSPKPLPLSVEHLEARELLSTSSPMYSLWSPTATPITASAPDSNSVEVGVQFRSDVAGTISGIRFYKGAGNTGTHVGQLFSSSGRLLASATFTAESFSGWQQVNFSKPITITANTTYVAAYHTNHGHYADDQGYFALSALNSGPLHATDGVFKYGSTGSFPNQDSNHSNYWVDVVFESTTTTTPPVANAGPAQSTNEGGSVTFAGSEKGGTGPFTFSWNFGDGTTSSGSLTPTHVYANHGAYTATLTVADSLGMTSSASTSVMVTDVAPTANAGGPYSGTAGTAISFTGSATDPGANDAAGFKYLWDFGDGTTSTLQNPTHAYANGGNFTVKLTVTEASGLSAIATTTANVKGANVPVANAGPAQSTNEGGAVTFAGSETGGTGPFTYSWNFGDGATGTGSLTPTHTYNAPGTFTATLTVTDALNLVSSSNTTVTVNAVPPTVNPGGPYSGTPGAAVAFAGSAAAPNPGDLTNATYTWNFGDGSTGTGQTFSHAYATTGTYTVRLTVTETNGLSATATTTTTVALASLAPQYIVTPYDRIPNFGFKPTVISVKSGNWSDPTVWSTGRLPGTGDIVDVMPGTTVTYDVNSEVALNTVAIQASGSLKFRPDVNTNMVVGNLEVLPGGYLEIGTASNPILGNVMANIDIANQAIDTTLDPEQFGTGLIVLGKMTSYGAQHTPYVGLSQEAHAGDTVLHLASAVTGWRAGDKLVLPDTRQLDYNQHGSNYVPQWEELVVASVSADGLSVTLTAPLQFDHLGGHDASGALKFLPHVINREGSIMIGSIDEGNDVGQTRGYVLFTDRADVNVQNTGFCELGRTTTDPEDDTTFDSNGNVTHIGTNEGNRNMMTVLNLFGPTVPQADGYQFTLINNVVDDDAPKAEAYQTHLWGIAINNSHYGLIQHNVVYNAAGAGIATVSGNETGNLIDGNLVMRVVGDGNRVDLTGTAGDGFWFRGPNNRVTNNVATDINPGDQNVFSYGYNVMSYYLGSVMVPAYQGADPGVAGTIVNMNGTPLLEFSGNTVYGASENGMAVWWLGIGLNVTGTAGVVKNLTEWNVFGWGFFGYDSNGLTIDGMVAYGDVAHVAPGNLATGIWFGDYSQTNLVIQNCDLQGFAEGLITPMYQVGELDVVNCYFRNVIDVDVPMSGNVNGSANVPAKSAVFRNDKFDAMAGLPLEAILMDYSLNVAGGAGTNLTAPIQVFVYNYNQVAGANYQVYYKEQAADYVMPQTDETYGMIGAPVAGLTNAQAMALYQTCIAGAIAPSTATTMTGIDGLVQAI
jgi:PKD repeat protein